MRKISRDFSEAAALFCHGGDPAPRFAVSACGNEEKPWSLDFSANINALGPPASVLQALRRALPAVVQYPDPACTLLAERLAVRHEVQRDQLIIGNGSNELIDALARALGPKETAIVEPTYTEYLRATRLAGGGVEHWLPEDDGLRPRAFDPGSAEAVWLGNPNNPTGHLWPRPELESWFASHPRVTFVVDEAFLPFVHDEPARSLVPVIARLPNVVVLRSLTKIYAIPGLRLGYAVAGPHLAGRLRNQVTPWSVSVLAQVAGLAALADDEYLARTRSWLARERGPFLSGLQELRSHLTVLESAANFALLRLRRLTSSELANRLRTRNILVRDASNFVGLDRRYVRVAIRSPEENRRLVQEMRAVLSEG